MKKLILFFSILTLLYSFSSQAEERVRRFLNLYIGLDHDEVIDKQLSFRKIKVNYSKKSILSLKYAPDKKTFRFRPKKEGNTVVVIEEKKTGKILYEFHVNIQKTDLLQTAHEIKSLVQDIEGVTVKILNKKVVLDGYVLLPQHITRIVKVLTRYGKKATSLVSLNPITERKIAGLIQSDLRKNISTDITVRTVNGNFLLQGSVKSKAEKTDAESLAKAYIPDVFVEESFGVELKVRSKKVINMINIQTASKPTPKKAIHLVMNFVQMSKDFDKNFRFQWAPSISDDTQVSLQSPNASATGKGVVSSITTTISNLLPKLNWAKAHGYARVLQSSSITVEEGKQGVLESVTSIPYQTIGADNTPSTQTANAGVTSKVTPNIVGSRKNSVAMKMAFASSSFEGNSGGTPVVARNSISSEVVVKNGQSVAVGGLVDRSRTVGFNKAPLGTSNPIITLHTSKGHSTKDRQFVIFVTPHIKVSASSGSDEIKKKFRMGQ